MKFQRMFGLTAGLLLAASGYAATEFYVAPNGSDAAKGTKDAPFKTLTQAQKAVRAVNKDMQEDVIVYLREGTYQLTSTFKLTNADGGFNGHYVRYEAFPGETPLVTGGVPLNGWEVCDEANNIWCIKGVDARFRQLYINNKKVIRARHPNVENAGDLNFNRLAKVDSNGRAFDVYTSEIKEVKNVKRTEIHLMVAWADQVLRLDEIKNNGNTSKLIPQDPERTRLFYRKYPMLGTAFMSNPPRQQVYYLENDMNFLDSPGEWFLDEDTDILYYKPRNGENLTSAITVAPNLETLVEITGESTKNKVQNIGIKGIVFAHSNFLRPSKEGFLDLQAGQFAVKVENRGILNANEFMLWHPNAGMQITNASHLAIEENVFTMMAGTGLDLTSGTNDTRVQGNVFKEIGGSGISVGKFAPDSLTEIHLGYNPSDKDEISTRDTLKYNLVTNVTNEIQGAVGIAAGYPRYIVIENNEVSYTNYSGISVGFGWTTKETAMTNNHINRNHIHHISRLLCDSGPIYTLSNQGTGSEIKYNYSHDISQSKWADYWVLPIYLDEGSSGFAVEHNSYKDAPSGVGQNQAGSFTEIDNNGFSQETADKAGLQGDYKAIANKEIPVADFSNSITQDPYKVEFTLPGVIQMEDYDVGGQGISYSDNDPENQGNVYREDGVDVVGFGCSDTLNTENCTGYAIGYTNAGEWVEYSFNAEVGAKYSFMARVASGLEGAGFMLYVDGSAVTDTVSIPAGDGWDTYVNVNGETAMIEKGQHILRVKFTGAYGNMDWIEFALERGSFGTAITNAPKLVPNNVKAKVFDINGRFVGLVQIRNASSAVEQLKTMGLNPGIYMVKVPGKNGFMVNTTH